MITLRSTSTGVRDFINYLNDCNYSFVLSTTTNSSIIVYSDPYDKYKVIFSDGVYMSKKEMILQKKLKKEIEKNTKGIEITFSQEKKIHFFEFDSSLRYMVETSGECIDIPNVLEMDITKAYYQMAYNLGYLSKKFFEITLKLPKHIRLRLLGSIATKRVVEKYKNGKVVEMKIIEDHRMRDIWFHICYNVGKVMKECSENIQDFFIFYWVDGIYFQKHPKFAPQYDPTKQIIQNIFQKNKLKFSINELEKISLQNLNDEIMLKCWKDGKVKSNFSVPHKKVKKYIFNPSNTEVYG
mgnify:CR=1 FL=1|tara:strand:- start:5288 stop:6175 length:888 start_codon:yes stop_codon:yes gene_type:complete